MATEANEGPVLALITKKVKALKKKLTRIAEIEVKVKDGKPIDYEQQSLLDKKTAVLCVLEEYDRLKPQLAISVEEERASVPMPDPPAPPTPEPKAPEPPSDSEEPSEKAAKGKADEKAEADKKESQKEEKEVEAKLDEDNTEDEKARLHVLINLLYFAQVFDLRPQPAYHTYIHLQQMERSACVSYDYSSGPSGEYPLGPADLDLIAALGRLVTSRPQGIPISHKNALDNCVALAEKWMSKSDEKLPELHMTFAQLASRLDRILSSDYFTQTPIFQPVNEQTAREAQAAAEAAAAQRVQMGMAQFEAQMGAPPPPASMSMGQGIPMDMEAPAAAFYAQQMDMGAESGYYPQIPSAYGQAPPGRLWPPTQPVPPNAPYGNVESAEVANGTGAPASERLPGSFNGDAKIESDENGTVPAGQPQGTVPDPAQPAPAGAPGLPPVAHQNAAPAANGMPPSAQQQAVPMQQAQTPVPSQGAPLGASGTIAPSGQNGPPKVSLKDATHQGGKGPGGKGKGKGAGGGKGGGGGDRGNYRGSYRGGESKGGGYGGGKYGGKDRGSRDSRDRHNGPHNGPPHANGAPPSNGSMAAPAAAPMPRNLTPSV